MTMRIAVISPDRRQGGTTASILLALAMAETQNLTSCITYTGNNNISMSSYLGITKVEDRTRNLTQVIKLLEANLITGKEIGDYCTKIGSNIQILDTASSSITDEDNAKLLEYALEHLSHDVVITDVATELYDPVTQAVLDKSDLIVMVLSQSQDIFRKLKVWHEEGVLEELDRRGLVFLLNQFDPYVGAFRDYSKKLGFPHRRFCKISYNPFVKKESNVGKLHTIMPRIVKNDYRMIELNNDIRECLMVILSNLGRVTVWGDES
ncbi:hypothetical protein [Cytobacillus sp. IB215316]|uniref:hypothetical protein n=1 Tax=Cytobacillus sp. IB215316 TaxID=3097354 RepID=UPI002A0F2C26|nr:hypothetical protein [Cytobacillus sp. IB215316]MDX8360762.1 hypothetical protein [Cytobacillus sp. IB215316]